MKLRTFPVRVIRCTVVVSSVPVRYSTAMNLTDNKPWTGWACADCLFLIANGETPDAMTADETAAWLAEIDRRNVGLNVSLGLAWEDHDKNSCPNYGSVCGFVGTTDDPCESREFSWSPCDHCGSNLGGSRDAITFSRQS